MRANLKAAIEMKFGSQLAFARASGIHPVKVSRLCRGWADPTDRERACISTALHADAEWLFSALKIPTPKSKSPLETTQAVCAVAAS
jgi:hypothetical protein